MGLFVGIFKGQQKDLYFLVERLGTRGDGSFRSGRTRNGRKPSPVFQTCGSVGSLRFFGERGFGSSGEERG